MKVLYMIDTLQPGGTERSLLELATHLKKVEPVVFHIYQGDALRAEFEANGVRVISGDIKRKYGYIRALQKTLKIIQKEKPDLIHTSLARANFVGRLSGKISRTPVISSFVNDSYSEARLLNVSPELRKKLKFIKVLDRWTSRFVECFVANSQATKDSNCESLGVEPNSVTVIFRGRDPAPFLSAKTNSIELRNSFGIGSKVPIILNVARLHPQKGQKDLLRAMALIRQVTEAHLLIAGEGPLRKELTAEIENLGLQERVTLLGVRKNIPELLNLADVFAFPSYYEGHPGALVEAMFAARAIIASDIPVHRETLADGKSGHLVPVGAPEALAEALIHLLKNQSESKCIGQIAREDALSRFHIDTIAGLHENLYQEIVRNRASKITK